MKLSFSFRVLVSRAVSGLRSWLQPTLVRRVVLALLAAFAVVFVALLFVQYRELTDTRSTNDHIRQVGGNIVQSFVHVKRLEDAQRVAATLSEFINSDLHTKDIPSVFLLQVRDQTGRLIYSSPEARQASLFCNLHAIVIAAVNNKKYRILCEDGGDWKISMAFPIASDSFVVGLIGSDLMFYMLIAFPLVVLPIWLAVSRGLNPLRRLSQHIASKSADDLQSLNFDAKYAELKPLVSSMDALLEQLRAKIAREHRFVQDAAHELRTPMAVISAQAHTLAKADRIEEREEAERRMDLAVARASHLIEQLLELARMDHQKSLSRKIEDVAELTRQALAELAPRAIARHIELSLDAPENLHCYTNSQAWLSIVNNLATNAISYIQPYGHVDIQLSASGSLLTLRVIDNGPGIALEHRALVFERFYREQANQMSGSGLGLPIVKQAVNGLGGTVSLSENSGGVGCCVLVQIPMETLS